MIHVHGSLPRMLFCARFALPLSALLVVAFLPCAIPRTGLLNSSESEAPVERDESSSEAEFSSQTRTRVPRNQASQQLLSATPGERRATPGVSFPRAGHRLPNHLLAPLRC